jgi:hypothetical protein
MRSMLVALRVLQAVAALRADQWRRRVCAWCA